MTARRPLTMISGAIREMPSGDTLASVVDSPPDFAPLASGQSSWPRTALTSQSGTVLSGNLHLTYFTARKSETTTQVRVSTGGTAAAATPTLCEISLFTIDGAGDGTRVAITASDTTLFAAVQTAYTRSWVSSYAMVEGQRYALGLMVISAATLPTFLGYGTLGAAMLTELSVAPRSTGRLAGQTSTPSSFTDASLSTHAFTHYGAILP